MTITNKKKIETVGALLIFLIPLILIVIFCHFMLFRKLDEIILIFALLLVAVIILIFRLHYKEFENSGFVITVKKKHPLFGKGFVSPILEFPVDLLKDVQIKQEFIYLNIASSDTHSDKLHKFKIGIQGFSPNQHKALQQLFSGGKN